MDYDISKLADQCIKLISDKVRNLTTLNIIVAGKTGAGKSTLINSVFREKLAETGMGKPVTGHMRKISKEGFPLVIYDTKGFELGKNAQQDVKREVIDTIKAGIASKNINDAIHCIWYCINTASNRIEDEEINWLKDFAKENQATQVPIIIILTQSFSKAKAEQMKKLIEDENLDVVQTVPVLASDYVIDEDFPTIPSYGLDTLITVMTEALPEELKNTLQNVQIANLSTKKARAQAAVAAATAAAFGEGFSPIPFSDCAVLIPTQVAMIASITAIFGVDISKSIIMGFISSALGAGGATIAGKTIVSNLMKLLPGAGTLLGGTISGSTAGVLTTALGEAYILLMEAVFKGEINSNDLATTAGQEKFKQLLSSVFKKK